MSISDCQAFHCFGKSRLFVGVPVTVLPGITIPTDKSGRCAHEQVVSLHGREFDQEFLDSIREENETTMRSNIDNFR